MKGKSKLTISLYREPGLLKKGKERSIEDGPGAVRRNFQVLAGTGLLPHPLSC